ncbi:DNA cytosine methyltransferase [Mucilaginibacter gotjawali]|uniref:DNA (cytosine-5-)-methyltransferase n=2 Tax=Mucilaginibacter gotjawali TaxID=1550579 RepID=A0A125T1V1_9SPHI|nr:DNA cytosine methyltransferase [Mucilaginibacter gotjawali]MBB3054278.1 DNA (cytosine-5)-methyltransferase 1 [Mucilaginibacter gotjawali]BAU51887.1 Modification methylase BspRI [Mucilaginibacter gotjawali]
MPFPIIDLFAGPGGLAEGFSSLTDGAGERVFKIKLSIEKDTDAHQTLTLRSFVRQFPVGQLPAEYYRFLENELTLSDLYRRYPVQYREAAAEAWQATLGLTPEPEIDERISTALDGEEPHWVLIGGPPCQAYSNVGRSRVGGIHEDDHRVYLYKEYLRIIARHHPSVFVMENVEGLLSATINGERVFGWMLRDLRAPATVFGDLNAPGYHIYSLVTENVRKDSDYLIKAEDYGIPQKRHRVILIGVRNDIADRPATLHNAAEVTLQSVIGMFPKIRSGMSRTFIRSENIIKEDGTIKKKRFYTKAADSPENWAEITGNFRNDIVERLAVELPDAPDNVPENTGRQYMPYRLPLIAAGHPLAGWYNDERLTGITHHESRSHLTQDLKRYLFAALYTRKNKKFPKLNDYKLFDEDLLPDHDNVSSGKFTDRFRVQLPDRPATTVTSHISKDGHYFIHYDHVQCRSLTVREAARIQTFPDNYYFCGSRTEQFHQVGNAVPPYLAFQIAEIVNDMLMRNIAPDIQEAILADLR